MELYIKKIYIYCSLKYEVHIIFTQFLNMLCVDINHTTISYFLFCFFFLEVPKNVFHFVS